MDTATIRRGFIQLHQLCDPRGHDLLDAIEETLVESLEAVEKLDALFQTLTTGIADPEHSAAGGSFRADLPDNLTRIGVSR